MTRARGRDPPSGRRRRVGQVAPAVGRAVRSAAREARRDRAGVDPVDLRDRGVRPVAMCAREARDPAAVVVPGRSQDSGAIDRGSSDLQTTAASAPVHPMSAPRSGDPHLRADPEPVGHPRAPSEPAGARHLVAADHRMVAGGRRSIGRGRRLVDRRTPVRRTPVRPARRPASVRRIAVQAPAHDRPMAAPDPARVRRGPPKGPAASVRSGLRRT
jgi:hypothetical protein